MASVRHHHADIPESASVGFGAPDKKICCSFWSYSGMLEDMVMCSGEGRAAGSTMTTTRQRQVRCIVSHPTLSCNFVAAGFGSERSLHNSLLYKRLRGFEMQAFHGFPAIGN